MHSARIIRAIKVPLAQIPNATAWVAGYISVIEHSYKLKHQLRLNRLIEMQMELQAKGKEREHYIPPSSNWVALKKTLPTAAPRYRTLTVHDIQQPLHSHEAAEASSSSGNLGGDSILPVATLDSMREMILGTFKLTPSQCKTGKFVSLDCEMVGVGSTRQVPSRRDSAVMKQVTDNSLARVSVVNFYGVLVLDCFVKQKEKVTDYRTFVSGVRARDLVGNNAVTFEEAQRKVADLLKDRILVGHAIENDLKALLLTHPALQTRDTQMCPIIRKVYGSRRPGLRKIIKQEFGVDIQAGEHCSVTDARATMAVYRIYKRQWDQLLTPAARVPHLPGPSKQVVVSEQKKAASPDTQAHSSQESKEPKKSGKRKLELVNEDDWIDARAKKTPKRKTALSHPQISSRQSGKTGISSGLGVVVKRKTAEGTTVQIQRKGGLMSAPPTKKRKSEEGGKWWESLDSSAGPKKASTSM